ncbi:hypothetical protein [uncultured Psychroserpens sp.]|uniref:hypothetical protein n=1 Tax=uncultured Psychroserpens sp. TaxID=255436 RepID=UPI002604C8BC|nr:hypothetical protein [uncultured Psychroserpens sp.]
MKFSCYLLLIVLFFSCQKSRDINQEKEYIKAQIDLVTQAHYNQDANLFYEPNANEWYDIRYGQITTQHKEEAIPPTQAYLDQMEFKDMVMRDEPIIQISEDATLATYSNSATIRGILNKVPVFWVVAWQSTLRKVNGEWKIISTTNTEATQSISAKVILDYARDYTNASDTIQSLYAMAECKAPDNRDFKTLILSNHKGSKMEQQSGANHYIMKQGEQNSWSYNVNTKTYTDSLSAATKTFVQGHELHWLSLFPEDRFTKASFDGIVPFKDQNAFKITFLNAVKSPVNFYYAFETYQPLGFEIFPGPDQDKVVIAYENWELLNSLNIFKKATFTQGEEVFEYAFTDIKINTLNDSSFESTVNVIEQN